MPVKPRQSIDQQALNLIKLAEDIYLQHFEFDSMFEAKTPLDAAVFGFVYAQTLTDKADVREVAYHALQMRFGWDDEYIATMVIGG